MVKDGRKLDAPSDGPVHSGNPSPESPNLDENYLINDPAVALFLLTLPSLQISNYVSALQVLIPRKVEFAELEDTHEAMYHRGWTDGLPVVPPNEETSSRCCRAPVAHPTK